MGGLDFFFCFLVKGDEVVIKSVDENFFVIYCDVLVCGLIKDFFNDGIKFGCVVLDCCVGCCVDCLYIVVGGDCVYYVINDNWCCL